MIDISNLGLPTAHEQAWSNVLRRWERNQRITKAEIVKLLEAGAIPENANDFIAAVVNGEDVYGRGNTKTYKPSLLISPEFVAPLVKEIEALIKAPTSAPEADRQYYAELHRKAFNKRSQHSRERLTANQLARKHVADQLGISKSRVGTLITEYNKKKDAPT